MEEAGLCDGQVCVYVFLMGLKSLCLTWTVPMLWAVCKTSSGKGGVFKWQSFLLCKIIENKLLCSKYVLLSIFAQPKLIQHVFRPREPS